MYARYKKNQGGVMDLKLSSLADAPPLSSSGKSMSSLSKESKDNKLNATSRSRKGMIGLDSLPDSKVTSMQLTSLNVSPSPLSVTTKGSSLPRDSGVHTRRSNINVSVPKAIRSFSHRVDDMKMISKCNENSQIEDDGSSENASGFSCEETDYEENEDFPMNREDTFLRQKSDNIQLSPFHSSHGSPELVDVNSLVVLSSRPAENKIGIPMLNISDVSASPGKDFTHISSRKAFGHEKLKPIVSKKQKRKTMKKALKQKTQVCIQQSKVFIDAEPSVTIKSSKIEEPDCLDVENDDIGLNSFVNKSKHLLRTAGTRPMEHNGNETDGEPKEKGELLKLRKEHEVDYENFKSAAMKEQEEGELFRETIEKLEKEYMARNLSEKKKIEEEHEQLVEKYKKEIKELKEKFQGEDSLQNSSDKCLALQSKLEELRMSVCNEEEHYKSLQCDVETLKSEKELASKEKEMLKLNIERELTCINSLVKEKALIQNDVDHLQEEAEKTENDLDILRTERVNLCSELSVLRSEFLELSSECKKLQKSKNEIFNSSDKMELEMLPKCDKKISTENVLMKDSSCQIEDRRKFTYNKLIQTELSVGARNQKFAQVQTETKIQVNQSCQSKTKVYDCVDAACQTLSPEGTKNGTKAENLQNKYVSEISRDDGASIDVVLSKVKVYLDGKLNSVEKRIRSVEDKMKSDSRTCHGLDLTDAVPAGFPIELSNYDVVSNEIVETAENEYRAKSDNQEMPSHSCICESLESCESMDNVETSLLNLAKQLHQPSIPYIKENMAFEYGNTVHSKQDLIIFYDKLKDLVVKRNCIMSEEYSRSFEPEWYSQCFLNADFNVSGSKKLPSSKRETASSKIWGKSSQTEYDVLSRAQELLRKENEQSFAEQEQFLAYSSANHSKDEMFKHGYRHLFKSTIQRCRSTYFAKNTPDYLATIHFTSPHSASCWNCSPYFIVSEQQINEDYLKWMDRIKMIQQRIQRCTN